MQVLVQKRQKRPVIQLDARIVVAMIGLILSVVLHELFHAVMHWGHITSIGFFTTPGTIVQIISVVPEGYNVASEEAVAYTITATVILITIAIIGAIHDTKDTRSFSQILFPKGISTQQLETLELMKF
ncbi:MAG: hypothetical protein JWN12_849 [Candidatus Saccharibacteria bacterium]|nr:hypothetical protein [Candidatus Saccharibacteria bacterium]